MDRMTYRGSGVDIDAGARAVDLMKEHIRKTHTPGVLGGIGGFGGVFRPDLTGYKDPVLVSGTDGVGTKLKIAFMMDKHDTVGIDCVAMCVNDIACMGARPLFFLDYIAIGKLVPGKVADIVKGISEGCCQAGCALIGGETAEMPNFYSPGEYDLAGFAVGIADRDDIIDGSRIREGDLLVGLPSSGLHSNGYSLARKVLFEKEGMTAETYVEELGCILGEELIKPTRIYVKQVSKAVETAYIKGIVHITGGGFNENIPRIIPEGLKADVYMGGWEVPQVFGYIQKRGGIEEEEMYRTFNMGIGLVMAVAPDQSDLLLEGLKDDGASVIGRISRGIGGVELWPKRG
ncbi:MAG: phosphoribosylformylglycinamidine cyclo-ligase [Firmicutes bacterium]|nr:phosphoribosylformylglycinamidine cyclo-ligase [Bacillota bacterium]MDD3297374.1 phosphoribosylformylglycinamidine cyclo-ligase [Bacillota bacterium]